MKHLSVGQRLYGLVIVFSVILIAVGALGLKNAADTLAGLKTVYEDRTVALGQLAQIDQRIHRNAAEFYRALALDPGSPLARHLDGSLPEHGQSLRDNTRIAAAEWRKYMAAYLTPEEKQQAQRVDALLSAYEKDLVLPVAEYFGRGKLDADTTLGFVRTSGKLGNDTHVALQALIDLQERVTKQEYERAVAGNQQTRQILLALILLGLGLGGMVSWRLIRSVTTPLGKIRDAVAHVQQSGDFTTHLAVQGQDEVAQTTRAFNDLLSTLRTTLHSVQTATAAVSQEAEGLAGQSTQAASAAAHASESTSAMAAAVEQMTVSINHVGDASQQAIAQAEDAGQHARQGGEVIQRAVGEINQIAQSVREVSAIIEQLDRRSERISGVIQVIKEVADQTNLLALNAAIEAARAGESGRGFAVVADEVRKLAERTGKATGEISLMITEIQQSSRNAVGSMDSAVQQVNAGVQLAADAGEAIVRIRNSTRQVTQTVASISESILEQGAASNTIAEQVEQVARASEQNSAIARQSAASAQAVAQQAGQTRLALARFQL